MCGATVSLKPIEIQVNIYNITQVNSLHSDKN